MEDFETLDPETQFLLSNQKTGNEWELFKENVRPLKRGRKINALNDSLKSQTDHQLRKSLLDNRRRLIEAIDDYKGDDPLLPWLECIKWVQESFPSGGDCSGLVVIYEQCVRAFWHEDRYKDDLRYLKVWLEYAENCADAGVIYNFLDTNGIGQTHAAYYIAKALHMESKNKLKNADEVFSLGIAREAQPMKKLEVVYKSFLSRSLRKPKATTTEELVDHHVQARSFGTLLATGEARRQTVGGNNDLSRKRVKQERTRQAPLSIYQDENVSIPYQTGSSKSDVAMWHTLGTRAERNKENNAIPSKWTQNKIPQKPGSTTAAIPAPTICIEVFIDDEYSESMVMPKEGGKSAMLQLRQGDKKDLKRETELLKENPLRNFPPSSLPR